jgi:hypothetical protein
VTALVERDDRQSGQAGQHEIPEASRRGQAVQQHHRDAAASPSGCAQAHAGTGQVEVEPACDRRSVGDRAVAAQEVTS